MLPNEWRTAVDDVDEFFESGKIGYDQQVYYYTPLTAYPRSLTPLVAGDPYPVPGDLSEYRTQLYFHTPFCTARCTFCPFQLDIRPDVSAAYVDAVVTQIRMVGARTKLPKEFTVYFGGGSPNLLSAAQVSHIMTAIEEAFHGSIGQCTMELHPQVAQHPEHLRALRDLGIKRVSFGYQSIDEQILRVTARHHKAAALDEAIKLAQDLGFLVNVDVMYGGFPHETLDADRRTFEYVLGLAPDWVTGYQMCIQEGTAELRRYQQHRDWYPDRRMMLEARATLQDMAVTSGWQYSGGDYYARPSASAEPRNRRLVPSTVLPRLWHDKAACLSFGSGNYSHVLDAEGTSLLWWSPFTVDGYLQDVSSGRYPVERLIELTDEDVSGWTAIAKLKTGAAQAEFSARQRNAVTALCRSGFVSVDQDHRYRLTRRGILVEDLVYASLLPAAMWREFSNRRLSPGYTEVDARYDWFYDPDVVLAFQDFTSAVEDRGGM